MKFNFSENLLKLLIVAEILSNETVKKTIEKIYSSRMIFITIF